MNTAKIMSKLSKRPITQFELTKNIVTNLKQFELTPTAKLVLILLTTCYNSENGAVVFPSMPFISDTLGIGLTATKQAIKDLVQQGLIIKSKRDKISGNHNKYLLTLKVQNTASDKSENELFKQSKNELFMITNKEEQIKEQSKLCTSETNISLADFAKLKQYAISKGAKNSAAYVNALIKNGSSEKILNEIKQSENIRINARMRIDETKKLIESYKNIEFEPIPEEIKKKADELIKRLKARNQ